MQPKAYGREARGSAERGGSPALFGRAGPCTGRAARSGGGRGGAADGPDHAQVLSTGVPLLREGERLSLSGTGIVLPGRTAGTLLAQCDQAVLLACTWAADLTPCCAPSRPEIWRRRSFWTPAAAPGRGRMRRGGSAAAAASARPLSDGPLQPRLWGPAAAGAAAGLRRAGRRAPAGTVGHGEPAAQPGQIGDGGDRPVRHAPARPHPGVRLLFHAGELYAAQGRKPLWKLNFGKTGSFCWTALWAPCSSRRAAIPSARRKPLWKRRPSAGRRGVLNRSRAPEWIASVSREYAGGQPGGLRQYLRGKPP